MSDEAAEIETEHADRGHIRSRVINGVAWKAASAVFSQLTRIATAVVLARLLAPHDYGLAGMVLILSSLVLIFSDLALGVALVQRRTLSEDDRCTVFWTSAATGVVFTLIGIGLSGPAASFYGEPAVKPLFAVFSLSFVVTALSSTQSALLTREMDFRSLEIRRMASFGVGAVVGIVLAALGFGAWALIAQQLAIATVGTVLLIVLAPWKPKFRFSFDSLLSLGSFSGNVFGTQLFFYVNRNLDNLLVGKFLGPAALGSYSISYNVMLTPFSQIASPIQEVLFPAFSRIQDEVDRISAAWLRVNRLVGAITVPGLLGLVVVAPDFVAVVLGDRWESATRVIQILAWVGLIQSLQRMNSSILEARNRTGDLLRYSVIVLVASIIAFVCGLPFGIVGVATGYAISSTIVEPYYTWLTTRALGMPLTTFLRSLTGVAQASALMLVAVLAARIALVHAGTPAAVRLPLLVVLGAVVYLPVLVRLDRTLAADVMALRRRRRAAATPPPTAGAAAPALD
jgi:O-antigen/teichoic acid export membrane protein